MIAFLLAGVLQTDSYKATFGWSELMRVSRIVSKTLGGEKVVTVAKLREDIAELGKKSTNDYEKQYAAVTLEKYSLVVVDAPRRSSQRGSVKIFHKSDDTCAVVSPTGDLRVFRLKGGC